MRERLRRTRVRLTLVYLAAFAAVAGLAAAALWFAFARIEYGPVDASLRAQLQLILAGLEESDGRISFNGGEQLPGETQGGIAVEAVLVGTDGTVLDHSGQGIDPSALTAAAHGRLLDTPQTVTVKGQPNRILAHRVELGDGAGALLILARPVSEQEETLALVGVLLAAGAAVLVLGAATLGYWLAGRALAPVRVMSATARDISEHDLHRRIDLDLPPGDELGELAATFNAMLARLEAAFEGLQRFTSDAAHELRAPLALMRTQVEVMLRKERTPDEYRESHRSLLAEIERLSRVAEQLLLLARADAGALSPRAQQLEVAQLLEDVAERWRPLARQRGLNLSVELPAEGTLQGDPDLLRRLLDNLLDNALRHTPPGGRIGLSAGRHDGTWRLAVEDNGPGVEPSLRPRLFERFTRADAARGRDTGGAGLGLSLCAAIAAAHGGRISLEDPSAGGARFVVHLPGTDR